MLGNAGRTVDAGCLPSTVQPSKLACPPAQRLILLCFTLPSHRSVAFAPWDDRLLVYGEDSKRVHLRRVPHEHEAAAGGSSASGGGGGEEEGQLGAGQPPAAALFEQNAQDGEFG